MKVGDIDGVLVRVGLELHVQFVDQSTTTNEKFVLPSAYMLEVLPLQSVTLAQTLTEIVPLLV